MLNRNENRAQADNENEPFLLESIQQAYWVGQTAALELSIPARFYVEADIPTELAAGLTPALQQIIQLHPMLRAIILPTGEQQILNTVKPYEIEVLDLRGLSGVSQDQRLDSLRTEMNETELPSDTWPQFDIRASRSDAGLRLHMRFALWMMDGWSFHILLQELLALSADPKASLPSGEMTFAEYVEGQRQIRQGPRWQQAWDYWQPRLAEFPGAPPLPLTRKLKDQQRPDFCHISRKVSAAQWEKLVATCSKHRITPSLLACAAYTEILSRYAGSSHFAITVLYSRRFRHLPRSSNVFGNFGSTILLEVNSAPDQSFSEKAKTLQRQFWRDSEHIDVDGIDVSRALQQRAGTGPGIGIPITFTAVTAPTETEDGNRPQANLDHAAARLQVPQVYLDHQMHFGADGSVIFNWDYVEQIFPTGFIEELSQAHHELISALADDETLWEETYPRAQKPQSPGSATHPATEPERLEAAFERQAQDHPDQVAVIDADSQMTYGELRRHALSVAHQLRSNDIRRGELVAVSLTKGWQQVAAVLGILYAGAAYVPVDPDLPEDRRNVLFSGSKARFLLTGKALEKTLTWPANLSCILVDCMPEGAHNFEPDLAGSATDLAATDLAYVIFTSGSTGTPKGVMIDHRGAWNTIADLNKRFDVNPRDKVLAVSSLSFDLSVYDIFGTLAAGATIVMPEAEKAKEASHWRELVQQHGVTIWNSVPALMQLVVEGARGAIMPSLRLVMLSGDWIPLTLPDQIRPAASHAQIYSLGGATEASIWSILYPIKFIDPEWRSIPYGQAMEHQSIHVLDGDLAECPPWVPGDLYIGGIGVALGYWCDKDKTDASFINHPVTGNRLYRTGDMGRYLADGEIEFLGRRDFQVKIQGYRVECAEVEAAILSGPEIGATVVSAATDNAGTRHLVAYVVPKEKAEPLHIAALRDRLRATLPAYMVPAYFVTLETLPLSDNGKVVRSALPAPSFGATETLKSSGVAPIGALEETIAELWRDVLDTGGIGRDDNFFALGGSSFAGMRLMGKLEERLDRRISFATLVSQPTIAGIADILRAGTDSHEDPIIIPIRPARPGEEQPPLFCVHPIGGNVMCYAALSQALDPGQPIYGIRAPGLASDTEQPLASIGEMAARYIEEMQAIQPHGPYHLVGWSLGGLVVLEMARLLRAKGETLGLTAMIDSAIPKARASRSDTGTAARFAHFAGDLAAAANLPLACPVKTLEPLSFDARFAWLSERMAEIGAPVDTTNLKRIYNVFAAGSVALETHVPGSFDGNLLLFAATQRSDAAEMQNQWKNVMPDIEIVTMDADHYSIMVPPMITAIAVKIEHAMAGAEIGETHLLRRDGS